MFCTLVYLPIVCFSLSSIVKSFEFLNALYKFPIIIIIIMFAGHFTIITDRPVQKPNA